MSGEPRQLSFLNTGGDAFEVPQDFDDRPLPEQTATEFNFTLQSRQVGGKVYYAVLDWVKGVAQADTKRGSQLWRKAKQRLNQSVTPSHTLKPLPYKASDGKTYQRDFATDEGLYAITQRMAADTGIRDKVLAYMAKSAAYLDWARRNPEAAIAELQDYSDRKEYHKLVAGGMTPAEAQQWLETRARGKPARLKVTDQWAQRGAKGRDFARLTNAVTEEAIGKTATQIKQELQVTNARDALSAEENALIAGTELFSSILHTSRDSQGYGELREDVHDGAGMIDRDAVTRAFSKRRPKLRGGA